MTRYRRVMPATSPHGAGVNHDILFELRGALGLVTLNRRRR